MGFLNGNSFVQCCVTHGVFVIYAWCVWIIMYIHMDVYTGSKHQFFYWYASMFIPRMWWSWLVFFFYKSSLEVQSRTCSAHPDKDAEHLSWFIYTYTCQWRCWRWWLMIIDDDDDGDGDDDDDEEEESSLHNMHLGPIMTALCAEQFGIMELHIWTHMSTCAFMYFMSIYFLKTSQYIISCHSTFLQRSLATLVGGKATWCLLLQNPYDHNPLYAARPKNCRETRNQNRLKYDVLMLWHAILWKPKRPPTSGT